MYTLPTEDGPVVIIKVANPEEIEKVLSETWLTNSRNILKIQQNTQKCLNLLDNLLHLWYYMYGKQVETSGHKARSLK